MVSPMPADGRHWHFGVLSFTGNGHLIPLIALSKALQGRGHRVTFFEKPKIGDRIRNAGLEFIPIQAPRRLTQEEVLKSKLSLCAQIQELRFNLGRVITDVECFLQNAPAAIAEAGVNALIVNEIALAGPTIAQMLGLPYFIVSTSIPHRFGWESYRALGGYRQSESMLDPLQRAMLELSCTRLRGPVMRAIDKFRRKSNLGPVRSAQDQYPCLAHITQFPRFLDLPGRRLPENFYYTGPFAKGSREASEHFPWERLDDRPLVYASMGTTRNARPEATRMIAEACRTLDVQLVIALGNRFDPVALGRLPGDPIVVEYAPQVELLKLANVVITHGGLNTVLETLTEGKPMIVIPLAYDQPANALRLKRLSVAEMLPVRRLNAARIREAIVRLVSQTSYTEAAVNAQSELKAIHGANLAADIIEQKLLASADGHRTGAERPDEDISSIVDLEHAS